ncbi:dehydrodolichyl diphosphate syntase complex subunit DHDDS-like protein, partial [Dinothrombium tinctorium]
RLAINILSSGVLPKHVTIILDGNRRWARQRGLPTIEGHKRAINTLAEAFSWIRFFNIPEVTAYVFSIENLKRPREEVDGLMNFGLKLLKKLSKELDDFHTCGIRFRVFGNYELIPPKMRSYASKIELATKNNSRVTLNFAFFYTSTDEISCAANKLKDGVENDYIKISDIDEYSLEKCFFTGDGHTPDYLLRTSGEQRLSDFFLWQLADKPLLFHSINWPDFSFYHFCGSLFLYNYFTQNAKEIKTYNSIQVENESDAERSERISNFIENVRKQHFDQLQMYASEFEDPTFE